MPRAAPQENTQGAPTEGLGQTVTFAPGFGSNVQAMQPVAIGAVNAGLQEVRTNSGVPQNAIPVAQNSQSRTLALLSKIADETLHRKAEEIGVQKYVEGMHRAMQGEAVADIAKNQPWYSTLFGEADVVEGARAYAANAKVATIASTMEENMGKLREMGPVEAQQYYSTVVKQNMTGERGTDAAIMQAMTRTLPSVMRLQAKAHYGFMQERAVAAMTGNFEAEASMLQERGVPFAKGFKTTEELQADKAQFFRNQVPPPGIDAENFQKGMTRNLVNAFQKGQFHAGNAMLDGGILDALTPEQKHAVQSAKNAGEQLYRVRGSYEFSKDLADLEIRASSMGRIEGDSIDKLLESVDTLNARYQGETGSGIGLILPNERAALAKHGWSGLMAERDRAAREAAANAKTAGTAQEKAAAETAKLDNVDAALAEGRAGTLIAGKGYSVEDVDARANFHFGQTAPAERPALLEKWYRDKFVSPAIQRQLDGAVGADLRVSKDAWGGSMPARYSEWLGVYKQSPKLADQYYPENGEVMLRFHKNMVEGGMKEPEAWAKATQPAPRLAGVSKDEMKAAVAAVTGARNSFFGTSLNQATQTMLANRVAMRAERYKGSSGSDKEAAQRAVEQAFGSGEMETIGSFGWERFENSQAQAHVGAYLETSGPDMKQRPIPKAADDLGSRFNDAVTGRIMKSSKSVDHNSIVVSRTADVAGQPHFLIESYDKDGKRNPTATMTAEEFRADYWKANAVQKRSIGLPQPMNLIDMK